MRTAEQEAERRAKWTKGLDALGARLGLSSGKSAMLSDKEREALHQARRDAEGTAHEDASELLTRAMVEGRVSVEELPALVRGCALHGESYLKAFLEVAAAGLHDRTDERLAKLLVAAYLADHDGHERAPKALGAVASVPPTPKAPAPVSRPARASEPRGPSLTSPAAHKVFEMLGVTSDQVKASGEKRAAAAAAPPARPPSPSSPSPRSTPGGRQPPRRDFTDLVDDDEDLDELDAAPARSAPPRGDDDDALRGYPVRQLSGSALASPAAAKVLDLFDLTPEAVEASNARRGR